MKENAIYMFLVLLMGGFATASPTVSWHVASDSAGGQFRLEDSARQVGLRDGWSCLVSGTSKHLPQYEARQTTCSKGESAFEFSVQCEKSRVEDNGQVRFKDKAGKFTDYIEVSCELNE